MYEQEQIFITKRDGTKFQLYSRNQGPRSRRPVLERKQTSITNKTFRFNNYILGVCSPVAKKTISSGRGQAVKNRVLRIIRNGRKYKRVTAAVLRRVGDRRKKRFKWRLRRWTRWSVGQFLRVKREKRGNK